MSIPETIKIGDLQVRPQEHRVRIHGVDIDLTTGEFEIVLKLAEHPRWVFSAEDLSTDSGAEYSADSVSVLISRLRHKFAEAGAPYVLETVRGAGYRLRPSGLSDSAETGADDELRDAWWYLDGAVMEAAHEASAAKKRQAVEVLDSARRKLHSILAE